MYNQPLHDLIIDIHALNRELQRFEEKYNLLSKDFYQLYIGGRLHDEELGEIDEYGRWAALYRMLKRREEQYESAKATVLAADRLSSFVKLTPYATPEAA